jgi:hypothetical protein
MLAVLSRKFVQRLFGDRQHAAGAAGAVVQ